MRVFTRRLPCLTDFCSNEERHAGLSSVVQEMNHFTVFSPNNLSIKFHRVFTDHLIEVR